MRLQRGLWSTTEALGICTVAAIPEAENVQTNQALNWKAHGRSGMSPIMNTILLNINSCALHVLTCPDCQIASLLQLARCGVAVKKTLLDESQAYWEVMPDVWPGVGLKLSH